MYQGLAVGVLGTGLGCSLGFAVCFLQQRFELKVKGRLIATYVCDFAYFDPPYHPTIDGSFTNYTKLDFTEQDQARLRDFAVKLGKQGVNVMLSNSDTPFIRGLYAGQGFKVDTVQAPRMVNCKPNKRGAVNELVITNY